MNSPSHNERSQNKDRRSEARKGAVAGVAGAIIGAPLMEAFGKTSEDILGISSMTLLIVLAITTTILGCFALWRRRT